MKVNFAELAGTISGFPMVNVSFKFSKWVGASYFNGN